MTASQLVNSSDLSILYEWQLKHRIHPFHSNGLTNHERNECPYDIKRQLNSEFTLDAQGKPIRKVSRSSRRSEQRNTV